MYLLFLIMEDRL